MTKKKLSREKCDMSLERFPAVFARTKKRVSKTNLPSMIQIPRFHLFPFPSIRTRITDGFPKDFKPRGVTPLVVISAMNPLFPTPKKGEDLISIYSHGTHGFNQ
jgi:hypothetical protein